MQPHRFDVDQHARRPLRETPPPSVVRNLEASGIAPADLLLCAATDIDLAGGYREQWLAVTADRLLVLADGRAPAVLIDLPLRDAAEFRVRNGVGSGLLQARLDGMYIDVLRYSNRGAYRFEKIARKLDRSLHGEPIEVHPDDHVDPRRCDTCGLLLEADGETCPLCVNRGAVLMRMARLMRPYRLAATGMMALLVLGIGLDLVSPQLTRILVDRVLPGGPTRAEALETVPGLKAEHLQLLLIVVLILAGVQTARQVVNLLNGRLSARIGTSITFDMRSRLVNRLQQLSVGFYDRQQVGSLVGRVAYDTEAMHSFINQVTGGFVLQVLMLIGVGAMMFTLDAKLALFTLIPAPLVIAGTIVFWRYIYPRNYRTWDASSRQAGQLSGLLSGVRVVKAFNQEQREMARFNAVSQRFRDARANVDASISVFNPVVGVVFQLGGWIVWYVGGRDVIEGRLTLGELMAFFGYLWMFYGPLATLPQFTSWLTNFATQAHRVFEILDAPVEVNEPAAPEHVGTLRGRIDFDHVTFGYNRHSPVLRDVTMAIKPGEMVGVVGRSGSGKSTLINLICRFYDVNDGRVLVDGVDVRDISRNELLSQIGVVLQEPFLFRGNIWENLAYGRPDASVRQVIAAAKAGNCHDFILSKPHAYDTWLGERGAGLSGGERQRIGIARVLLTDPRILILDEATSSIDAESEASIQAALAELVRGRTTIAIAHRLSTLRNADRIVMLDHGRVVESGPHDDLMAANGRYARLVRMQQSPGTTSDAAPSAPAAEVEPGADTRDAPLPPITAHHPRWLRSEIADIHLGTHGALHVTVLNERIYAGVHAVRCLPVQYPERYLSLRYTDASGNEREIGIIDDLNDWPDEARQLVRESLAKRYFVHTILGIDSIMPVNNYLSFEVETDLGPQQFTMRWQADRAHDYGEHGKMLLDTDENRYLIPDVSALPDRDRRLFERFIYW